MSNIQTIRLAKSPGQSWGFRLQGGKDFATPLCIQKVNDASVAAVAGLQAGDAIVSIANHDALSFRHKEAQDNIIKAGNNFEMTIQRGGSTLWKPQVTALPEMMATPQGPVATQTSLAAAPRQEVRIGSKHNTAPAPYGEVNGVPIAPTTYNSPLNLYSDDNIAETLSAQAEVLGKGVLGINFSKYNKEAVIQKDSPTYKLIHGEDEPQAPRRPPPRPQGEQGSGPAQPKQDYSNAPVAAQTYAPKGPGFSSVTAPKPSAAPAGGEQLRPGQNICSGCCQLIVGVFVRVKDKNLHADCFKCATCGASLKNVGYYNINEKLYCDVHAKQAAKVNAPGPNLTPVTVNPGAPMPQGAVPAAMAKQEPEYQSEPQPQPEFEPELEPEHQSEPQPEPECRQEPNPLCNGEIVQDSLSDVEETQDNEPEQIEKISEPVENVPEPEVIPEVEEPLQDTPVNQELSEDKELLIPELSVKSESINAQEEAPKSLVAIDNTEIVVGRQESQQTFEAAACKASGSESKQVRFEESSVGGTTVKRTVTEESFESSSSSSIVQQSRKEVKFSSGQPAPTFTPAPAPSMVAPPKPAPAPAFTAPKPAQSFGAPAGEVNVRAHIPKKGTDSTFAPAPVPAPAPAPVIAPAPAPIAATIVGSMVPMSMPKPSPMPGAGPGGPVRGVPMAPGHRTAPKRGRGIMNQSGVATRVPICANCQRQIRGPFVSALGKTWCPDHFVCGTANCCKPLIDMGFVEEQGALHCEDCYEKFLAPVCGKCDRRVKGDCLNAVGKQFHPECFCCAYCGKIFGSGAFYLEDGLPYCETDWNDLFTTKCVGCNFPIEAGDRWVEALSNNYHSQCFKCSKCNKNLEGQSFFAKGGKPFCKAHASRGF